MKKQLKSLVAVAVALTLALGFTSCKNNDPEPEPTENDYAFLSDITLSAEFTEYCDITIEYTDLNGKNTHINLKDCPIEEVASGGKMVKCYVFSKSETTKEKGKQVSIKAKYAPKAFPEDARINIFYAPLFTVGTKGNVKSHGTSLYMGSAPKATFDKVVAELQADYSNVTMKVDKDGVVTLESK